jgi:hypothetical protein
VLNEPGELSPARGTTQCRPRAPTGATCDSSRRAPRPLHGGSLRRPSRRPKLGRVEVRRRLGRPEPLRVPSLGRGRDSHRPHTGAAGRGTRALNEPGELSPARGTTQCRPRAPARCDKLPACSPISPRGFSASPRRPNLGRLEARRRLGGPAPSACHPRSTPRFPPSSHRSCQQRHARAERAGRTIARQRHHAVSSQSPGPAGRAAAPRVDPTSPRGFSTSPQSATQLGSCRGPATPGSEPLRMRSSVDAAIPTVLTPELPAEARPR